MTNVVGAKTTKAKEQESLKAARTKHRVGAGQLFIQPTAHADREAAKAAAVAKVDEDFPSKAQIDDYQAEVAAIDFVKGPAPVEAQAAVSHVRPTYRYQPTSSIDTEARRYPEPTGTLIDLGEGWKVRTGEGLTTVKQAKWMINIASRPSITDAMRESLRLRLEQGFARTAASAFINKYKETPTAAAEVACEEAVNPGPGATPAKNAPTHPWNNPQVEAGRYAVEHEGVLKFYRVSKGKGRWAGHTFVEVQASDERHPLRNPKTRNEVLALIAVNPLEASVRYGTELGSCYACGRTLTDATSRELGIGPDCRNK